MIGAVKKNRPCSIRRANRVAPYSVGHLPTQRISIVLFPDRIITGDANYPRS